jgi:hypothetical protein
MKLDLFVLNVYSLNCKEQNDKLDNVVEYFYPNVIRIKSVTLIGAYTVIVVDDHIDDKWNK